MSYMMKLRETFLKPEYKHIPIQASGTGIIIWRKKEDKFQILLQKRGDFFKYGLFGGGIELGESYEICAKRELKEEAGLTIDQKDLVLFGVYAGPDHVTKYPNGDIVYHTIVTYALDFYKCKSKKIKLDNSESIGAKWFDIKELESFLDNNPEKKFFKNNIPIIRDIVKKFHNLER